MSDVEGDNVVVTEFVDDVQILSLIHISADGGALPALRAGRERESLHLLRRHRDRRRLSLIHISPVADRFSASISNWR